MTPDIPEEKPFDGADVVDPNDPALQPAPWEKPTRRGPATEVGIDVLTPNNGPEDA